MARAMVLKWINWIKSQGKPPFEERKIMTKFQRRCPDPPPKAFFYYFLLLLVKRDTDMFENELTLPTSPFVKLVHKKISNEGFPRSRLEICQKIYTTGFRGKKFYTLKVRKLRLFLRKINSVNSLISVILVAILLEFNWLCKILTVSVKIELGLCKSCSFTQILREIALFSSKNYTVCTNFTRPPVVTVATNLNSGAKLS